jgi:hypothetical protein
VVGDASENFEDWSGYIRRTSDGFSWRKEVLITRGGGNGAVVRGAPARPARYRKG